MAAIIDQVKNIVLVMMENRSFDHMLGHLSLDNPSKPINGLKNPLDSYANDYNGGWFPCFERDNDKELSYDIPHEWNYVETQLRVKPNGTASMHGFVDAYAKSINNTPNLQCDPMGFFPKRFVPITEFLANQFCVCDNWFSPIPTSTQPNRTMAFSGDSAIYETKAQLIPIDNDIFHWMDQHGVRWRVYHEAFSFFSLYNSLWPYVLGEQFRRYEFLHADMLQEHDDSFPQVIVVEPCYQDAPHLGTKHADDNHAPLAIGWGEDFLRRTYQAVTANPDRWKNTAMIVYYDEHGGFFDHEPPPKIPYKTTGTDSKQFKTTGPRIPGIIISPLVKPGSVCSNLFDHTSVLQFLAEKFTPGTDYSLSVARRQKAGINSLSVAFNNPKPIPATPAPTTEITPPASLGKGLSTAPQSNMAKSFELAGLEMLDKKPAEVTKKYPELYAWRDTALKSQEMPKAKRSGASGKNGIKKKSGK